MPYNHDMTDDRFQYLSSVIRQGGPDPENRMPRTRPPRYRAGMHAHLPIYE